MKEWISEHKDLLGIVIPFIMTIIGWFISRNQKNSRTINQKGKNCKYIENKKGKITMK